ncbi:hypothetical protein KCU81_g210, partial [Aureobasidium melanogenum]
MLAVFLTDLWHPDCDERLSSQPASLAYIHSTMRRLLTLNSLALRGSNENVPLDFDRDSPMARSAQS